MNWDSSISEKWKSGCENEEALKYTSAGCSWYFCRKILQAWYGSWILLYFSVRLASAIDKTQQWHMLSRLWRFEAELQRSRKANFFRISCIETALNKSVDLAITILWYALKSTVVGTFTRTRFQIWVMCGQLLCLPPRQALRMDRLASNINI